MNCMNYVWTMFETIMVLLVNVVCEICIACEICICHCGLCVFCCELKGAKNLFWGGIINFRRLVRRPTKIAVVFSSANEAHENSCCIFVGLGKADENMLFLSVPTKIVVYFRLTYFRRLFSSVCRRK
jgi:hypothetical protein